MLEAVQGEFASKLIQGVDRILSLVRAGMRFLFFGSYHPGASLTSVRTSALLFTLIPFQAGRDMWSLSHALDLSALVLALFCLTLLLLRAR